MTIEEAKELKIGDRVIFPKLYGRTAFWTVDQIVERGVIVTTIGHRELVEWNFLVDKEAERL